MIQLEAPGEWKEFVSRVDATVIEVIERARHPLPPALVVAAAACDRWALRLALAKNPRLVDQQPSVLIQLAELATAGSARDRLPFDEVKPDGALLADLVAPIDGTLDAWLLALRLLPNFSGTITELVATAERATR
ncbi:hypothetical protein ACNAW0_20535 [Micromonospora sp. SL1-18]|uniref:hypothetical protein n=1 Tax=Micromonospora sp. SL1-18 TaxID=3399128 RepID=UPI003A4DCAC6